MLVSSLFNRRAFHTVLQPNRHIADPTISGKLIESADHGVDSLVHKNLKLGQCAHGVSRGDWALDLGVKVLVQGGEKSLCGISIEELLLRLIEFRLGNSQPTT